jgi:hypothetical protein
MTAPALARTTAKGRVYVHPVTGEEVPSVTTIISGGVPKPALTPWAAKMAAEYAVANWETLGGLSDAERIDLIKGAHRRRTETASDLGTAVHDAADHWVRSEAMPKWEPGVEPFMEQFCEFLAAREPEFLMTEVTVWNRTHGYAGTFDWLALINGKVTLGDHKTGKNVYPEVGLQLSALSHAEFILRRDGTEEPLPAIDLLGALHLRPRSWALIPVGNPEECWQAFLAAKVITDWSRKVAPAVLGARLREVTAA